MIRQWWSKNLLKQCQDETGLQAIDDESYLSNINKDFGRLSYGEAVSVFKVNNIFDAQKIFQFANRYSLPLTIRAQGLSQSGQSLAPAGGAAVDVSELNSDVSWQDNRLVAGCSASWKSIIKQSLVHEQIPYVIPYNTNLTLGGVLSVGGLGSASCQSGVIAANIESVRILSPKGELLECSSYENQKLFQACLSGCGLFGIIYDATLKTRKCKGYIKTYQLTYDDALNWTSDQQNLLKQVDFIEAFITTNPQTLEKEMITIAASECLSDDASSLDIDGLHIDQIHEENMMSVTNYLYRHDARIEDLKTSGAWQEFHPWYECYVSLKELMPKLNQIVDILDESVGGIYHLFPVKKMTPKYFMMPHADDIVTFNILVPKIEEIRLKKAISAIKLVNQIFMSMGGKRYISGWFPEGHNIDFWQKHYEDLYLERKQIKMDCDPNQILCSNLFPEL